MHAVVVELILWKQLSIHEYFIVVALSSTEAPAGYPNLNSNNRKIESGRGTMGFYFSLSPALPRRRYKYNITTDSATTKPWQLLKASIGSCQKSVTEEPRFSKPLNNEVLGIMNDFLYPSDSKILLVWTWCHGGLVGGQKQMHFSPLGTRLFFHVNSLTKILLFWPPTWLPCHMFANQEYEKRSLI